MLGESSRKWNQTHWVRQIAIINPNCHIEPKAYHKPVAEKQTGKGILLVPLLYRMCRVNKKNT